MAYIAAESDYHSVYTKLTFQTSDETKYIPISIIDDNVSEADEDFQITMIPLLNAIILEPVINITICGNINDRGMVLHNLLHVGIV